ncbi:hypothetical protein [Gimesia sp.]|uniref:hypothetical protein n=1 Tax=Gimesia sp. TaxID=2024833 RepID=UPI003A9282E9
MNKAIMQVQSGKCKNSSIATTERISHQSQGKLTDTRFPARLANHLYFQFFAQFPFQEQTNLQEC